MVLPNDPDLVDILAKNGVDISVSEGEQQVPACPVLIMACSQAVNQCACRCQMVQHILRWC